MAASVSSPLVDPRFLSATANEKNPNNLPIDDATATGAFRPFSPSAFFRGRDTLDTRTTASIIDEKQSNHILRYFIPTAPAFFSFSVLALDATRTDKIACLRLDAALIPLLRVCQLYIINIDVIVITVFRRGLTEYPTNPNVVYACKYRFA